MGGRVWTHFHTRPKIKFKKNQKNLKNNPLKNKTKKPFSQLFIVSCLLLLYLKKKNPKNHHATKCSNCCCATSTPTTRRTSWSRWGQLSYGLSLCGRFSQGCHRSHAFRKILLGRTRAIHSGLPGHDFPDVVGICLRQLPTTCRC